MPGKGENGNLDKGDAKPAAVSERELSRSQYAELKEQLEQKDRELKQALVQLEAIQSTLSFKLLIRLWRLRRRLLPEGTHRNSLFKFCLHSFTAIFSEGPISAIKQTAHYFKRRSLWFFNKRAFNDRLYQAWIDRNEPKAGDAAKLRQEALSLRFQPRITILMAVDSGDESSLRAAIESVRQQIYQNWQLCVAVNVAAAPAILKILDECLKDDRVNVANLKECKSTSEALNAALALAAGEFAGILGQEDQLAPRALLEAAIFLNDTPDADFIYSDEDKVDQDGSRHEPFFKPGFSPDLLMSMNYIGRLAICSRQLLNNIGGFRDGFQGAEVYDLILRASEQASRIARIPKVLYHRREATADAESPESPDVAANEGSIRALEEALARRDRSGRIELLAKGTYRVRYQVDDSPLISIIVPTKNKSRLLRRCLESIEQKSTYGNYEVIVVDNGSTQPSVLNYLGSIREKSRHHVLSFDQPFNYSRLNNFAVENAHGEFLLFLNNDTEVITPEWLEEMAGHAQRTAVGAVGAKLIYTDGRVQHGGIILGIGDIAGHAFYGMKSSEPGYMGLAQVARNCSAVTAACLMIRRSIFEEVGGFDESLAVAFNDIDLCLRLLEKSYVNVYTPYAVLNHYEGKTRGEYYPQEDAYYFRRRWSGLLGDCDPFYNPNLSREVDNLMALKRSHE